MNINGIFEDRTPKTGKRPPMKRTYDVRVTLNKNGKNQRFSIRFGFLNEAARIFGEKDFIQVSNVTKMQDRIYFKSHDEKTYLDVYKLSSSTGAEGNGRYMSITPSAAEEKIYRLKWIGKTFNLKYDDDNSLYYIELGGEE